MKIYIETSVVSFWFDRKPHNRDKRRSVRRFLLLCRKEVHVGYVSRLVRAEIEQSKPGYREQDLRVIGRIGLGDLPYDSRALLDLVQAYRQDPLLRRAPEADLRNVSTRMRHLFGAFTVVPPCLRLPVSPRQTGRFGRQAHPGRVLAAG